MTGTFNTIAFPFSTTSLDTTLPEATTMKFKPDHSDKQSVKRPPLIFKPGSETLAFDDG